jgi:hypothetical protein
VHNPGNSVSIFAIVNTKLKTMDTTTTTTTPAAEYEGADLLLVMAIEALEEENEKLTELVKALCRKIAEE